MRHLKKISLFIMILVYLVCGSYATGGKLYRWVDEEGVVHYSDRKPEGSQELIDSVTESDLKEISPLTSKKDAGVKPPFRSPIEYATRCTFTIKSTRNSGTGFFVSSNGYAITAKHVVNVGDDHLAVLNNQNEFPIGVIATSDMHDLALILVITSQKTPYLSVRDPVNLVPGERVFAVGSSVGLQATVTDGVFTGFRKKENSEDKVIQFSAPVNPGNSGGPLVDAKGHIIGVVSWKIISKKGIPVTGLGFAVPSGYLSEEYGAYLEPTGYQ